MAIRDIGLEQQHADLLRGAPLFAALDPVKLAKIAARLRVVRLDDGDAIVRHGEPGDALYVISHGRFGVFSADEARLRTCGSGEVIGEMALLTGGRRSATVRAEGEAEALRLDRDDFDSLLAAEPSVSRALARALSTRLGAADSSATTPPAAVASPKAEPLLGRRRATGLVLAAVLLGLGWFVAPAQGFSVEAWHAAATFVALVPLMVCEALPEAAIALVLVATWVLGGITSPEVALSGFANGSWVLTIAIFIIGAVIASSGVLFRIALWSVAHARGGFKTQALALCITGWISSAAVPNPSGRMLLVAPAITEMAEAFGYAPGSRGAAGLAMAALLGFGQTFAPFLTSSTTALLIFTLLPASSHTGLDWGTWALRAAPTYLVLMCGLLGYIVWHFSPRKPSGPSRTNGAIPVQRALLGKASRQEWLAGGVVLGLLLGFASQPLHHVDAAWIAVVALGALAALGLVTPETLRLVNWNCALWFGALASMVGVFSTTSLDRSLAGLVAGVFDGFVGNPLLFVGVLALVCFGVSFVLRFAAAAPMLTVALAPIAAGIGIDAWVIGFVALIGTSGFFLPFQSSTYQAIHQELGGQLFSHRQVRSVGLMYAVLALIGLLVSVPVWHLMGLVL